MADTNDALLAAIDKMNASTEALAAKVEALEAEKQAEAERVAAETKAAAEAKAKADAEAAELKELEDERAKAAKERKDTAIGGDEDGTPVRYTRQSSGPVFKNLSDVLAVKADSAPDYKAFIEDFQAYNDDMLSYRMGAHQHGNPADHKRAPGTDWFLKPSVRSTSVRCKVAPISPNHTPSIPLRCSAFGKPNRKTWWKRPGLSKRASGKRSG